MKERTRPYPAAVFVSFLAATLLLPSVLALSLSGALGEPTPMVTGYTVNPNSPAAFISADRTGMDSGFPPAPRNATTLIADGTFDAIPGPWNYTNGTTGAVTARRDPSARARLGEASPALRFDSMDNVFGANPWRTITSNPPGSATSNLSQETVIRAEGNGSMRDDVTINQNGNMWGGAMRDDPLPWNWSGYDRVTIVINRAAASGWLWAWVYVEDQNGLGTWSFFTPVAGWYRYAVDLNMTIDLAAINFIQVAFSGQDGTTATVYVDDIELLNSTAFDETARVGQTFPKSIPTAGSPNSLVLAFDLQATSSMDVISKLVVTIDNRVEWSETPVVAGARTIIVDVSNDPALQGTGSFTLGFSLGLNRTGWEESSMTVWIDNVSLLTPGALARIAITPPEAVVPVAQTAVFAAEGRDADGNRVPLAAVNWSSTIGQIVAANATAATFRAPTTPGTGTVSATQGAVTGTANVTVDPWGTPQINGVVPNQVAQEDAAPWALDLTFYASNQSDPADTLDNLKWYLTGVDGTLYNVFGQDTFGRHDLVFTSRPDAFGTDDVTLWLEDRSGARTQQALQIEITPVNDPPVFVAIPEISVAYDMAYTFNLLPYIRDVDTPAANLSLTTDDPNHITTNGLNATYLYGKNFNGKTVFVRHFVNDGQATGVAIVTVRVADDAPPRLAMPLPDLTLPEDTVLRDAFPESLRTFFNDTTGDQLFFSYNFTHLLVWINDTGTKVKVDVTGLRNFFGRDRITFRGTDPSGAYAEYTVNVDVTPVNDPPMLAWTDDVYVRFNESYRLDLTPYVSDVDNATSDLTLTTSDPQGARVDGFVITFYYPQSRLGPLPQYVLPVNLTLADGLDMTAHSIRVHVSNNHPPELAAPFDDLSFNEDEVQRGVIYLDRHFVDVDGDRLAYTAGGRNVTITLAGDKVTLTPDPNWFGQEVLVFRATDPKGAFALGYLLVDVLPVNDPPVFRAIPDQVRSDGGPWILDLRPYVTDVDTDLSSLVFSTNSPYIEVVGFLLVFNFPNTNLDATVTVTAYDSGLTAATVIGIRIRPASPWGAIIWPGLGFIAAGLVVAALVAMRQSAVHRFRIENLLLISIGGLLIAHASHRRDAHGDEDILAGMLTAIVSFAHDSFREEPEGLKRFEIGNSKVALERSEHAYVAVIGTGPMRNPLSSSLRHFLADIEERYGVELQQWSGMIEDLPGLNAMMESFAGRGRYRRGDWMREKLQDRRPAPRAAGPEGPGSGAGNASVQEEHLRVP